MIDCDADLAKKYNNNRQEFMQEWHQKFTETQKAEVDLNKAEIAIRRDYLRVPKIARKSAVIESVVDYKMLLPQDDATFNNFVFKQGPIYKDARDEKSKRFIEDLYSFIEKRLAEGAIQEPNVMYKGEIPEVLANFAESAKRVIAEKRPLSEMQLPERQENSLVLQYGHLPNKYDLSVMKNALEISNICRQTINKQAEKNVGGKNDNSGQDKLAAKMPESYESRKTILDAQIVTNIQNKYSK